MDKDDNQTLEALTEASLQVFHEKIQEATRKLYERWECVRCNLFHGEKSPYDLVDQALVASGFRVLVHFLDGCVPVRSPRHFAKSL